MTQLRRQSTSVHENSELGHSPSEKGLGVRILEQRIGLVHVLVVITVHIGKAGGVTLEGRRVSWIGCEWLMGLAGES